MDDLKHCSHCAGKARMAIFSEGERLSQPMYYMVECIAQCNCTGKLHSTPKEAAEYWNSLECVHRRSKKHYVRRWGDEYKPQPLSEMSRATGKWPYEPDGYEEEKRLDDAERARDINNA